MTVADTREDEFQSVVAALKRGECALFPTDTVYGLGVSVIHCDGPQELYALKGRPSSKPIPWLIASIDDLQKYGKNVSRYAFELAEEWPGALTLIVEASSEVPVSFMSAERTIGLRMPSCTETLALLKAIGGPLAATSANSSGMPAPKALSEVEPALLEKINAHMKGNSPLSGVSSKVIDCTGLTPRVLR